MIRRNFTLSMLMVALTTTLHAQEASVAAGGLALGSGGSVSYSVGQIFYVEQSSASASITPGVQQSFYVEPLGSSDHDDLQITLNVFPNPASHNLTIAVAGQNTEKITCRIYDLRGKHIESKHLRAGANQVDITHLTNSIYLFAIAQGNQTIQTYKIVKTH